MKNISSNKNLITIAVICVCCVIIFAAVVVLITRGKSDDFVEDVPPEPMIHTQVDENGNIIVAEGSDYLPDSCVGSWMVGDPAKILQSPRNADMAEDKAAETEADGEGVLLAYDCYKTSKTGSVFAPYYKVQENATPDMMDAVGMQSDGILDGFGENPGITRIQVYDQSGQNLYDTIFIIDATIKKTVEKKNAKTGKKEKKTETVEEQHLVYYGAGNFVFDATKVEAVG